MEGVRSRSVGRSIERSGDGKRLKGDISLSSSSLPLGASASARAAGHMMFGKSLTLRGRRKSPAFYSPRSPPLLSTSSRASIHFESGKSERAEREAICTYRIGGLSSRMSARRSKMGSKFCLEMRGAALLCHMRRFSLLGANDALTLTK